MRSHRPRAAVASAHDGLCRRTDRVLRRPEGEGAPDDLEQVIVDFIDGAEDELQVAVQELDNEDIARALVRGQAGARRRRQGVPGAGLPARGMDHRRPGPAADAGRDRRAGDRAAGAGRRRAAAGREPRLLGALLRAEDRRQGRLSTRRSSTRSSPCATCRAAPGTEPACWRLRQLRRAPTRTPTSTTSSIFRDKRIALEYGSQFNQLKAGEFGRGTMYRVPPRDYLLNGRPGAGPVRARQHARARAGQADAQAAQARRPASTSRSSRSPTARPWTRR